MKLNWLGAKFFSYWTTLFDKFAPETNRTSTLIMLFILDYKCISLLCSQWLYDLCRGIEFEAVKPRQLPKSIGCSKNFPGKTSLATKEQVKPFSLFNYWSRTETDETLRPQLHRLKISSFSVHLDA